ncbi:MAG: SulP family inorganic anion transporter [Chitinophagaceae bacterium]|nr:SulP family inorganic anion transporter [Chitinophagaceae bacterium]MCW5904532.1 SulP family inorganic anion transporter [Chitinophagaceae bacterium]
MKRTLKYYKILWLRNDLPAGLAVFFVALPLCLGIALASGAPLYSGLLSGIIGGLVVSLISGSQLAVSGPAAGLTTIVAASILAQGDYKIFLLSVIVAGLFQVVLGIFKLGVIANYFPSSVIKGMLAAIGIILIAKQIPIALGYDKPNFWTSGILELFTPKHIAENINNFNHQLTRGTIIITIISLFILIVFKLPFAKKIKIIPAPLLVVVAGIIANMIFLQISSGLSLKPTQLVYIPNNIFADIALPDFTKIFSSKIIWKDGIIIGLLATLETLLCIEAIDKLDRRNRITPINRELFAQGFGNMLCGVFGAIPITAVVVRGSANIDAGARTKFSAFTHGLLLLLAVLFIPFILNKIPYASLSAILIITGYNLTKPTLYKNMWSLGLKQFLPFIITIIVIILTDLLVGVTIGLLISIYYIIRGNFKVEYKISSSVENGIDIYLIKLNTDVTFLNKANLKKTLDEVPENSILTIDGSHCNFIDYDIVEIISEFESKAKERKIKLILKGIEKVNVMAIH